MKKPTNYAEKADEIFEQIFCDGFHKMIGDDNNGKEPEWDADLIFVREVRSDIDYALNHMAR